MIDTNKPRTRLDMGRQQQVEMAQLWPFDAQKKIKINIATPAYKAEYHSSYVRSLYALLTKAPSMELQFSFSEIDYSDIVVSRNYLISNFFYNKEDCSHMLFIDADMGFPFQLIADMVGLGEGIVGVAYQKRTIDLKKLHTHSGLPFRQAYAQACDFIGKPSEAHPRNPAFRQADCCGTGIMLISRQAIQSLIERCPEVVDNTRFKKMPFGNIFDRFITPFSKINLDDRELSEDLSFCHRWTHHCYGKIFLNITHDIEHASSFTLSTCYSDILST